MNFRGTPRKNRGTNICTFPYNLQSIYRALSVFLKFFLELHKNRFQEQETFDTALSHIFQYKANA